MEGKKWKLWFAVMFLLVVRIPRMVNRYEEHNRKPQQPMQVMLEQNIRLKDAAQEKYVGFEQAYQLLEKQGVSLSETTDTSFTASANGKKIEFTDMLHDLTGDLAYRWHYLEGGGEDGSDRRGIPASVLSELTGKTSDGGE